HVWLAGCFDDRDRPALAARAELDLAVLGGEDRVVAPDTRAGARAEAGAALVGDDHPGLDLLAGEHLHAEHLRVRVAPVARGAEALLMRHLYPPSSSSRASSPRPASMLPASPPP